MLFRKDRRRCLDCYLLLCGSGIRNRAFAGTADGTVPDITIAGLVLGSATNKPLNRPGDVNANAIRSETKAAGSHATMQAPQASTKRPCAQIGASAMIEPHQYSSSRKRCRLRSLILPVFGS